MWKADDESTAYLLKILYAYLAKGYSVAEALRQAKLDYMNDAAVTSAQKIPGYWAHLRLIGTFEKSPANSGWILYLAIPGLFIALIAATKKGRLKFRRPVTKQI